MNRRHFATETQRQREFNRAKTIAVCASVSLWLFCSLSAFAATHVTAAYDLGSNPHVMTTVGAQPQYGLVFVQRNKSVTYNSVEHAAKLK